MEEIFEHNRGLYAEPNFSFEDTFCREITSCMEYEQDSNANMRHKGGQERMYNIGEENSNACDGPENMSLNSNTSEQCSIHELQTMKRGTIMATKENTSFEDEMLQSYTEIFSYDSSPCEDSGSCEQSSGGTWSSADDEVNNGLGCPRVRLEPMKRIRRLRANDRERRRMRSLNRALESLKKCIPVPQSKRRVTKLEILRIACSYIRSLSDTLRGEATGAGNAFRKRNRTETVVNGFSVAQRLEILSSKVATAI
ncbi:basic helix-loop-helix transcription factor amos-like [Actinia tenebrosa]|uniref:Basic helix-loop-helix transcription factor amos-like n=1 Tax=Actinia tenebrosa TaxID=6105 RepID=A0A6P8HKU2_ACTTE|nr:basic helix-loop-helix transcription factor amos-like [Actinia tenebrosa]